MSFPKKKCCCAPGVCPVDCALCQNTFVLTLSGLELAACGVVADLVFTIGNFGAGGCSWNLAGAGQDPVVFLCGGNISSGATLDCNDGGDFPGWVIRFLFQPPFGTFNAIRYRQSLAIHSCPPLGNYNSISIDDPNAAFGVVAPGVMAVAF